MAQQTEHPAPGDADEVREFANGQAEMLKVGEAEVGRLVIQPGWRLSNDVKPIGPGMVVDKFGASNDAR